MRLRLFTCILLFSVSACAGKEVAYVYDYNENCSKAYQYLLSMHFADARAILASEARINPNNLMVTYLADYEDCITLLLNCDKADYEQRLKHFDERLEMLDKGDRSSPWYCFCKAGLYLHWSIIQVRVGEDLKAAIKFRKFFSLLKENQRLFTSFEYNDIYAGLRDAVIGSLPGSYKWLAAVFGIKGDLKKGADKLSVFVASHNAHQPMRTEAVLYALFVKFYMLAQQQEVWDYMSGADFPTSNNLLNTFVKTHMALDFRKSKAAVDMLHAVPESDCNSYPIFYYQEGMARLATSDTGCISCFRQYLKYNRSDIFIKDAWLRMAYAWYLNGNMQQAEYCRQQIKLSGSERTDADKQAEKFANGKTWPMKKLLHACLLTDGGYHSEAFTVLSPIDPKDLTDPADKAEYFYRLGKVYQESRDDKRALEYYQYAINTGKKRHEQFAARAALQMGLIYEHTGVQGEAMIRYRECLDMPYHDFQNAIDHQAKAGISRIEGK